MNSKTGRYDNVGLPDLKNGNELKTLESTSSYNTIDSHIKSARRKGARRLYLDNTDNDALSDKKLRDYVLRSRRFSDGSIYVMRKDGRLERIR